MKGKYSGLITCTVALVAIVISISFIKLGIGRDVGQVYKIKHTPTSTAIDIPSQSSVKEMEKLDAVMDRLARIRETDTPGVNFILFGYQPVERLRYSFNGKTHGVLTPMRYVLSLAFVSGKKRFCVIDSAFYEEGGNLPDGARIIRVEPDRVLLSNRKIERWIPLAEKETIQKEKK